MIKKAISILMILLILLACSSAFAQEEAGQVMPLDTLFVQTQTEMTGNFFSKIFGRNTTDIDIQTLIHGYHTIRWVVADAMFTIDQSVISGMAVTQDADGNRTYNIILQQDMMYSDGTPITAREYVFAILLFASPEMRNLGADTTHMDIVQGVDAYQAGEAEGIAGVRLLGEYQFSVTVKAELYPFFYELSYIDFQPVPLHVLAPGCEVEDDGQGAYLKGDFNTETLRKTLLDPQRGYLSYPQVSSGPYRLKEYQADQKKATFEINPNYKGDVNGDKPSIQYLIIEPMDAEKPLEQFLAENKPYLFSQLSSAHRIGEGLQGMQQQQVQSVSYPRNGLTMISFSCENGPLKDENVRKAIASAFDRESFVAEYVGDYGLTVTSYYGLGQWMNQVVNGTVVLEQDDEKTAKRFEALTLDDLAVYEHSLETAEALLDKAGYVKNEEGMRSREGQKLSFTLYTSSSESAPLLEKYLQQPLFDIGVELQIEEVPFSEFLSLYYREQPRENAMFFIGTNFQEAFNPAQIFSIDDAGIGVQNVTGIADEKLSQAALAMAGTENSDVIGYLEKWIAFLHRWNEVLPAIPVYTNVFFDFYSPYLQNFQLTSYPSWASAIISAYLGEPEPPVDEGQTEAELGDGEEMIVP